ncbi:tRNA isopentenyl-2-thiomethyl-A-37 hydroxylase MiaE, partial [Streptomyces brasiliscabiei]|uniref:tRNA isopentenyl-2-thiomethyl-A-37 hydroxylase MiaE n=1 Tax=Streptomyces brasiliscabiei TaxID=2736302 RepID=UPI003AF4A5C1
SEARHYQDYLTLAQEIAGFDITERVTFFSEKERELIITSDTDFKFHSGVPNL